MPSKDNQFRIFLLGKNSVIPKESFDSCLHARVFAYIAKKILALYNDPYLFCERNGVSAGMLDSLRITYGYSNIAIENKK